MPSTTNVQVFNGFAAMLGQVHDDTMPFWGSPVPDLVHPAWHVHGYTLERTCLDGFNETYRIVREPRAAFALRMRSVPVDTPHPDDVKFVCLARFRHDRTDEVWSMTVINHHAPTWASRTTYRPQSGQLRHCTAPHPFGPFNPASAEEIDHLVENLEADLPVDLMRVLLGECVDA